MPSRSTTVVDWLEVRSDTTPASAQALMRMKNSGDNKEWKDVLLEALSPAQQAAINRTLYELLEARVGRELAERMTSEQLDEFEGFIDAKDEAGALQWLESNFPEYGTVTRTQYSQLLDEVRRDADIIRARLSPLAGDEGRP